MQKDIMEREIAEIIKGFRQDSIEIEMNQEHVHKWISQFSPDTQNIILEETLHILKEWYFPKDKINLFLDEMMDYLKSENENATDEEPMKDIYFWNIQESGKSQSQLVEMLNDRVNQKYGCGIRTGKLMSEKYYVYLDDGLYTGSRLRKDIKHCIEMIPEGSRIDVIYMIACQSGLDFSKRILEELCKTKNIKITGSYQAEYWNYTEEGYLMFSGVWFSEELYVLTLSGAEEHTALRVQPLDETYRELSRKYLRPIGFEQNNMFIVDWSEDDFGALNFYDMYDILYPKVNGQYVPYIADDNLAVSAVYRIPKEEFESVIMKYFNIDSETLQSKTVYYSEDSTYEYKPRGFEEVEYPEYPYSEVVDFTENSDGTITLTANVVFPYAGDSKVYAHEVVVRPLEDGGVQYVSNQIIPSENNYEETWHTPRLTLEEWEELYGGE